MSKFVLNARTTGFIEMAKDVFQYLLTVKSGMKMETPFHFCGLFFTFLFSGFVYSSITSKSFSTWKLLYSIRKPFYDKT